MRLSATFLLVLLLAWPCSAERHFTSGAEEASTIISGTTQNIWTGVSGTPTVDTTQKHSGTNSILVDAAGENVRRASPSSYTSGTLYIRCYFRITTWAGATSERFCGLEGSGPAASLRLITSASNNRVACKNEVVPSETVGTINYSLSTWYRGEMELTVSDTTGVATCRFYEGDETTPLETLSTTAGDTLPTAVGDFYVGAGASSTWVGNLDDFAMNDGAAGIQTSWAGPGKIATVTVVSDDTVAWTKNGAGCTGSGNFECVNETGFPTGVVPDDLTTYNSETAEPVIDRYNIDTLPAEIPSDADMILADVYAKIGGSSSTGTNTSRYKIWDETGSATNGATMNNCDINGWQNAARTRVGLDAGTDSKANVQSYDIGFETISVAQSCRLTAEWVSIEWIEAPPAPSCTQSIALMGVGCR